MLGAVIAYINYVISKHLLKKKPDMYAMGQIVRQAIQIGYLILIYALGGYTPWSPNWLLVGGVLGITLPMLFFTARLVKFNDKKEGDK